VISSRTATGETAVTADVRANARRRRVKVWAARLATLVIIIGGWQLLTNAKIVDQFFWGQPSGIVR
jgi:NitT/TauT family transport system permease protein